MNRRLLIVLAALASVFALVVFAAPAFAQGVPGPSNPTIPIPRVNIGVSPATKPSDVALSLQILLLLTVVTLAPTMLVLLTSFTRIVIVLSFVRTALGTQQVPPTQVLVGLSLLLTFFVMNPVIQDINKNALQPYMGNKISQSVAVDRAAKPLRVFMFKQTREKDIALFYTLSKEARPAKQEDVPTYLLVPGVRHQRAQDGVPDRLRDLHPVHRHRHGGRLGAAVDGDDDDPAGDHLAAVQDPDLLAGRRLEPHRPSFVRELSAMTYAAALSLGREAIFIALLVCAPALLLGLVTGLVVSVFQAVTQIQEPTLAFIPKIVVVALAILLFGPFMLALLTDFTTRVFTGIPAFIK